MKKKNSQLALAVLGATLSLQIPLVFADGPELAYDSGGALVNETLDPNEYQVNADGALEDPDHRMSDVARAYRNGYINRGKADDALMKQRLAEQQDADRAQVQKVSVSVPAPGQVSQLPPPPPPGAQGELPLPSYSALPPAMPYPAPAYAPPPYGVPAYGSQAYGPAPYGSAPYGQAAYAPPPPVQYVPIYPEAAYAPVQPLIAVTPDYGSAYYGGWGHRGGHRHWH